jgi:hypothetical protein
MLGRTGIDQHRLAAALDDAAFLEMREHRTRIVCNSSATSVLESEGRA